MHGLPNLKKNQMFVYHQCKSNREGLPMGGGTCCLHRQGFVFHLSTHTDDGGRQGCPQSRYTFARVDVVTSQKAAFGTAKIT